MSKSRHAYLVPMVILLSFVAFLFTNCDRAKFPKQPVLNAPPTEMQRPPQPTNQPTMNAIPPTAEPEMAPPPPTMDDLPKPPAEQ